MGKTQKNTKRASGHSPDRYSDSEVTAEEPDRREFHVGQENMDRGMLDAIAFPESRASKERWQSASDQLGKILRRFKGKKS